MRMMKNEELQESSVNAHTKQQRELTKMAHCF